MEKRSKLIQAPKDHEYYARLIDEMGVFIKTFHEKATSGNVDRTDIQMLLKFLEQSQEIIAANLSSRTTQMQTYIHQETLQFIATAINASMTRQ